MSIVAIGYRFSPYALRALLQSLRLGPLPGAPLTALEASEEETARRQLVEDGLALLSGDTIYVDKNILFLLKRATHPDDGIALTDGRNTAVLWATKALYILGAFPQHGDCTLTPLPDLDACADSLEDVLCRVEPPLWVINLFQPEKALEITEYDETLRPQLVRQLLDLLNTAISDVF